ncbi:hypothetical protein DTO021D3_8102 [Paecilomyces variotii]|nr:hypothetical protein DTO032I3_7664 [Paecilomyces variotii]KAJ9275027.1 hypothetical protein DTO021D3_8102 [Paecilomyces variotii]KAJ9342397.1 hypothetical protein DTO027B6_5120 [Paecilomyces variotii]KAJ9381285.1 hypothetical protein DTO032I4_6279 [Paecilomyces variotii]
MWGFTLFGSFVVACFFTILYMSPSGSRPPNMPTPSAPGHEPAYGPELRRLFLHDLCPDYRLLHVLCPRTVIRMATGSGLLPTLKVKSGQAAWIGYQFLLEAKVGVGLQTADGMAIVMFTENLASTVMVSVAEEVFTKQLVSNVARYMPEIDTGAILKGCATSIRETVPSSLYRAVLFAYNKSLNQQLVL